MNGEKHGYDYLMLNLMVNAQFQFSFSNILSLSVDGTHS